MAGDWRSKPRKPRLDMIGNALGIRHGMYATPTWKSWDGMKQRCTNKRSKDWPSYGGRGITMDPAWSNFAAFLSDMGERPEGCTLGRINNDAGYSRSNCRWEGQEHQNNNRRSSRLVEHGGRRQTIAQWARELGMSRQALRYRLDAGWSVAEAIATGVNHANRRT